MQGIPKDEGLAALEAALAGAPAAADPLAAGPAPTVDCQACGYTIDAVTGEPVAGPEEGVDPAALGL